MALTRDNDYEYNEWEEYIITKMYAFCEECFKDIFLLPSCVLLKQLKSCKCMIYFESF